MGDFDPMHIEAHNPKAYVECLCDNLQVADVGPDTTDHLASPSGVLATVASTADPQPEREHKEAARTEDGAPGNNQ